MNEFAMTGLWKLPLETSWGANRRVVLQGLATSLLAACGTDGARSSPFAGVTDELRNLEATARGRLGAYIFDTQTSIGMGYREGERFAHCSSFKMSLAAMILKMSEDGEANLSERLHWSRDDMLHVSPVTEANIKDGLTVEQLAHATLVTSDNTAANVLLKRFGGPSELTSFWKSLGDPVSRLDRYEPALNETPPGTDLDTTTPMAMARTTAALVHGNVLSEQNKAKLRDWMTAVRTGAQRIRAGFPPNWQSGDKTGTGIGADKHTYVDIAFGIPPGREPIVVTAYFEPTVLVEPMDPVALSVLAKVGTIATRAVGGAISGSLKRSWTLAYALA